MGMARCVLFRFVLLSPVVLLFFYGIFPDEATSCRLSLPPVPSDVISDEALEAVAGGVYYRSRDAF